MSIDFMSMINKPNVAKEINPIKIYDSLDRESTTGELRTTQEFVLDTWFAKKRNNKDLIVKLNTGAGKTLIGLLMLESKINETNKPCIYLSPNKYLADQVKGEAKKFGIQYCEINTDNILPIEFLNGEKLLITHVQKLFNGKSIFGIKANSIDIETIILDDSHSCIDSIKDSFCIKIKKESNLNLYNDIVSLFEISLKSQGLGTYLNIINDDSNDYMQVPYWDLIQNSNQLMEILNDYHKEKDLIFKWDILKDSIEKCSIFLNSKLIEIVPPYIDIDIFKSFSSAQNRILMSATTQDDSFFINGLNLKVDSIINPLVPEKESWFGEKMILIPSLLDSGYDRNKFLSLLERNNDKINYGVVALSPSFNISNLYTNRGFKRIDSDNINESINDIKRSPIPNKSKKIVFSNRYDGIDLPDNSCRILILDSLPSFNDLHDNYEYVNRSKNIRLLRKMAQKIEQGLGRAIRGDKDYCIVIIFGNDLIQFIQTTENKDLFSMQTKKQIEISFEMLNAIKQSNTDKVNSNKGHELNTIELINKSLGRDDGWKTFYKVRMDEYLESQFSNDSINRNLEILELEMSAEKNYYFGFYDNAISDIDILIEQCSSNEDKSWYLERKARYKFHLDKHDSNQIQIEAFRLNNSLLKPKEGISYSRLNFTNEKRVNNISNYIKCFNSYPDLKLHFDTLMDKLSFGRDSETFERAFDEVGRLLGFRTQRPDKMLRTGPDNLWVLNENEYIFFECKSEVKLDRVIINKTEAGQMNNHCGWFEEQYPHSNVNRVLVIPTNRLSKNANFTHDIKIMRRSELEKFKSYLSGFMISLKDYDIKNISNDTLNEKINFNKLSIDNIKDEFLVSYEKES